MLYEKIWWGRYTGDSVEALNIGAAVVALTRQLITINSQGSKMLSVIREGEDLSRGR